jgi:hypothetical protein
MRHNFEAALPADLEQEWVGVEVPGRAWLMPVPARPA